MTTPLLLSLLILISQSAMAQIDDSLIQTRDSLNPRSSSGNYSIRPAFNSPGSTLTNTYVAEAQKKFIIRGNITFATYNIQLSLIENEILDIEGLECNSLLKRDTSALRKIWLRDFTLDAPQNEIITNKNPVPYYISLSRFVEKCNVMENVVYTSGFELIQELKQNGKVDERVKRNFFHVWMKKNGSWKLSTKTHQ